MGGGEFIDFDTTRKHRTHSSGAFGSVSDDTYLKIGRVKSAWDEFDQFLCDSFDVVFDEEIPHTDCARVLDPPLVWRYFVVPSKKGEEACLSDDDYVVKKVMIANTKMDRRACFLRLSWPCSRKS